MCPEKIRLTTSDALIVIDVQYDFLPGGSLAVQHGDRVIPVINQLTPHFGMVILTQDWHPPSHISFADQHPGKQTFETITLPYGPQTLWPRHCVQGTHGAELSSELKVPHAQLIIRKGFHQHVDSYSAFLEADRRTPTGLTGYLRERQVRHVYLCGLATDFCVAWSALDARKFGFEASVIADASQGIDLNGSLDKAWADMQQAGVHRVMSESIA
jgi:nicotinamidase/pyrazinamidase